MSTSNRSIDRAWDLLRAVAEDPGGCSFTDLRQAVPRTGAATLSRLLKALQARDLLVHVQDRYRVGPGLLALADRILPANRLRRLEDAVERLAATTGQSALACERMPQDGTPCLVRRCRRHVEGGFAYGDLDQPLPLLAMAFGWPLLAGCSPAQRAELVAAHRRADPTGAAALADELDHLDRDGVLVRAERLDSQALGCTRIVAGIGRPAVASIGITVIGHPGAPHPPATVANWRTSVRAAAESLI